MMDIKAQRSILQCVRLGYDKFFGDQKGLPRFGREDHSFEMDGCKLRRSGENYTLQVKGVGKLRFKESRGVFSGAAVVKLRRVLRRPLGTGYDVQLVRSHPVVAVMHDDRDTIGIDVGVKANCSLSNGTRYAPIRLSDRKRRRLQKAVSRAKRQSKSRAKRH